MELRFLGSTSDGGSCPNLYATDRGTAIVQGAKVTDPDALAQLAARGLPDHETVVEVPLELFRFAPNTETGA
jgi:hypothetical protein